MVALNFSKHFTVKKFFFQTRSKLKIILYYLDSSII